MSDFFLHFKPFARLIENENIESLYSAILILRNEPYNSVAFIKGESEKEIGILEEIEEGSYVYVSHKAVDFFNNSAIAISNELITAIDGDLMNSGSRETVENKLNNYHTYTRLLFERFNKKPDDIKQKLQIIPEQLSRIEEALDDRISHFTGSIQEIKGTTSNPKSAIKIKWCNDEASLGNLFYDLLNGNTYDANGKHTGKKYVSNNEEELAQAIAAHFVFDDNTQPKPQNMERYFRGKEAKRNYVKPILRSKDK